MKRVFGLFELIFDVFYLVAGLVMGCILIFTGGGAPRLLAGCMALVLVFGDAFHLVPRILSIAAKEEDAYRRALGRGKQLTSITMTIFYLLLWQIGLLVFTPAFPPSYSLVLYGLAALRIGLCLLPQNRWLDRYPPLSWGIWRNVPFFLLGAAVAVFFGLYGQNTPGLGLMWLAIAGSFAFYLPVVLFSNRNAKIGMLMLPKTCAYLWMLAMCLSL